MKKVWIPIKVDRNTARPNDWKNAEKPSKQPVTFFCYWGKRSVSVFPDIKGGSLKLVHLRHIEWKIAFWNVKISQNPNIIRVKRAPRSATFPNLGSNANESVSECSQRPHMDEQGAKSYAFKNVIGCDERCWIISMSQAFPKQLFIAAKERTWTAKKSSTKNNRGAPSQVIKDLTRSPAI